MICVENEFNLKDHKWEEYKDTCFYDGDFSLVVEVWLYRVDEDSSGLTFEEWDPSVDTDEFTTSNDRQLK